MNFGRVIWG